MKLVFEKHPEYRLSEIERCQKGGKGFYYHESHQPIIKVRLLLKNLESEPEMYVNNLVKKVYRLPSLKRFLEDLEFAHCGTVRIHSGAVASQDGKGTLLVALSDVGKTTLSLLLVTKEPNAILGDDMVRISEDGMLSRWQTHMGIFPHRGNFESIDLNFKEKIRRALRFAFLSRPPMCNVVNPNMVIPYTKLPRMSDNAKLETVILLEKGDPSIEEADKETAILKLLATSMEIIKPEGFPGRMFNRYCYYNPIVPHYLEQKTVEVLNKALEGKKIVMFRGWSPFDYYDLYKRYVGK